MNKKDLTRQRLNLMRKYQALFLNLFNFEGLAYGVKDYLMKKLLHQGQICAFDLLVNKEIKHIDNIGLGFGSFVPQGWDWKNHPLDVTIFNEKGSPLIPTKKLKVDEEAVLLYLDFIPQHFISEYVDRIMDIEATIRTNLNNAKMPFIVKTSNKKTINAINEILKGEEVVWTDDTMFEVLKSDSTYIIDKLTLYKSEVEAELLTILGIENVKFEKKAQMVMDEVNSNDTETFAYKGTIKYKVDAFFKQIKEVLGYDVSLKEVIDSEKLENKDLFGLEEEEEEDDGLSEQI